MRSILLGASGIVILVFSGVVQGVWTDRWADRSDLVEAAARLELLPSSLGEWRGEDYERPRERDNPMTGVLSRRYVHGPSGRVISIYVDCGKPGLIAMHTPEVCYQGSGFEAEAPTVFSIPAGPNMPKGELWTARFVKEKADARTNLRLFWSWHTAGGWKVAENPRVAFACERLLHKLYVVREMADPNEPINEDPCIEFMRILLPAIEATYFSRP